MRMWFAVLPALLIALAACEKKKTAAIVASPYGDGVEHREPVFFTGKHYNVTFRYIAARASYDMKVEGQGRKLGGGPGDLQIVEQVASSALSHFACPTKQRAQIIPETASHVAGAWILQARCG